MKNKHRFLSGSPMLLALLFMLLWPLSACGRAETTHVSTSTVASFQPSTTIAPTIASPSATSTHTPPLDVTETPSLPTAEVQPTAAKTDIPAFTETVRLKVKAQMGGEAKDIVVREPYAYLAAGLRLVVLDIADPNQLFVIAQSDLLPGRGIDLSLDGELLYWMSDSGHLLAFDLGDPRKPSLRFAKTLPPGGLQIVVDSEWAFVSYYTQNRLRVFRLEPLGDETAEEVAHVEVNIGRITYTDRRIYGESLDITVIDVTDPTQPRLIGHIDRVGSVAFVPPFAYAISESRSSLTVYDLTEPSHPVKTYQEDYIVDPSKRIDGMGAPVIVGDRLYFFDNAGEPAGDVTHNCPNYLWVMDISNPQTPKMIAKPHSPRLHCVRNMAAVQNRLYTADMHGLSLVDISNYQQPRLLDRFGSPSWFGGMGVNEAGDVLYVGTDMIEYSLNIYPLRRLFPPDFAGLEPMSQVAYPAIYEPYQPGLASGLALSGNTLFVPGRYAGLSAVDVSNPLAPRMIVSYTKIASEIGNKQVAAVVGDRLYVNTQPDLRTQHIEVVDVTDPANPKTLALFDAGGTVFDMEATHGYLYVLADRYFQTNEYVQSLMVLDVRQPTPVAITELQLHGLGKLDIEGQRAYVSSFSGNAADPGSGLAVIDLSDPTQPVLSGTLEIPPGIGDVAVHGDYAVMVHLSGTVLVADISNPQAPALVGRLNLPLPVDHVIVAGEGFVVAGEYGELWVVAIEEDGR